jgi:hypothetical protein
MNKFLNWFNKRIVLTISFFLLLLNIISRDGNELIFVYSYIFIFVFIFSLITFKLRKELFYAWRNFSFFWVLLSLIIISFLPMHASGLDLVPVTKGTIIFVLSILYSVISMYYPTRSLFSKFKILLNYQILFSLISVIVYVFIAFKIIDFLV